MATKVDFSATRKQAEEDGQIGGGGFYKVKEGDNRIRLMSECLPHISIFSNGDKSFKWLTYILDRRDGEVKPFFMAHRIYKSIEALQVNPDYAFSEVPMPYDITIHAKKAGTKDVEYTLLPARKETSLTALELEKLETAKPLAELKQLLDEKQASKASASDQQPVTSEMMDTDVPF